MAPTMKAAAGLLSVAVLLIASRGGASHAAHDPARFASVLAALRSDMRKENRDLGGEIRDILHGAQPSTGPCYNLFNNVNYDVVQRLDHDASGNALFDRNWLGGDISVMRTDITTLQEDVRDLENDGVPVGTQTRAISSLRQKIAQTRTTANTYIGQVNADVTTGYRLARRYWRAHRCPASDQVTASAVSVPHL